MPGETRSSPIRLTDLIEAFEFVSVSQLDEHQAYVCKETGRIIFVSEAIDLEEDVELPEDPEEAGYFAVPHRRDLDLGKRLALSFAAAELPDSVGSVRDIFSRKGAYGRFKHFLQMESALERWYVFEERATQDALRQWCDEVGVTLAEDGKPA
jgi:hypothetical protein